MLLPLVSVALFTLWSFLGITVLAVLGTHDFLRWSLAALLFEILAVKFPRALRLVLWIPVGFASLYFVPDFIVDAALSFLQYLYPILFLVQAYWVFTLVTSFGHFLLEDVYEARGSSALFFTLALSELALFLVGNAYLHYSIFTLPNIPPSFAAVGGGLLVLNIAVLVLAGLTGNAVVSDSAAIAFFSTFFFRFAAANASRAAIVDDSSFLYYELIPGIFFAIRRFLVSWNLSAEETVLTVSSLFTLDVLLSTLLCFAAILSLPYLSSTPWDGSAKIRSANSIMSRVEPRRPRSSRGLELTLLLLYLFVVLDATRTISEGSSVMWWRFLQAFGLPIFYFVAVLRRSKD